MSNNKGLYYFRHLLLMATVNKVRLFLVSIGIFIAVFLFSAGTILTNSYYHGKLMVIEQMENNTAIITSIKEPSLVKQDISSLTSINPVDVITLNKKESILSTRISNEQYITLMANIHGVSDLSQFRPIFADDEIFMPVESTLIKGRTISQEEINKSAKVVVIDELTESLLFSDKESSIGSFIELGVGINGITVASDDKKETEKLQVIGVVKNSYSTTQDKIMLKKELNQDKENIYINTSIYCPVTTMAEIYDKSEINRSYIYKTDNESTYNTLVSNLNALVEISDMNGNDYTLTTKDSLLNSLEMQLSYTKNLINIILLILCIISGISIMSITFFSVKERIPEIGVRKAFGASKLDIVFQFMFEMILIALIISIAAVALSSLLCRIAEDYLTNQLFMPFTVSVSISNLLIPVFIGIIEAAICSIIPSLYAANIKVTDSLRFE